MKSISIFVLSIFLGLESFGQARGNESRGNETYKSSGNATYGNAGNSTNNKNNQNPNLANANFVGGNLIELSVKALINVTPDKLVAIFSITQVGETAADANTLANQRIANFSAQLEKMGITKQQIFVDVVSLVPVYEVEVEKKLFNKNYNEIPKGFELQRNVHVQIQSEKQLPDLITAAADAEIYDFVKVEYVIKDSQKIYDQLQTEGIKNLNAKMEKYKLLGINFTTAGRELAEDYAVTYPSELYQSYQAFSSSGVEAIKKRYAVNVARKSVTQYYNRINTNGFDVVINPDILEPVVQYTYHLRVRYQVEPKLGQKEYLLVTPNGDIKALPKP
jgi:uncharacterized protein YggE